MVARFVSKILPLLVLGPALCVSALGQGEATKLPFAAEVLLEDLESYKKDIARKAADAVARKRADTIARLKSEAAKQKQSGNSSAAAAIVRVVAGLEAEEAARLEEQGAADRAVAGGGALRWQPMFGADQLGGKWKFHEEPNGGWSFDSGTLEIDSAEKFAGAVGDVPAGDLVVRASVKMRAGEGPKEKQIGLAFTTAEADRTVSAIVQAPDLLLGYNGLEGGQGVIGSEKAGTAQRRFIDLQMAWVGNNFIVFLNGKEAFRKDLERPRGGGELIAFANDAKGFFKDIEVRIPDQTDRERLAGGRPVK